MTASELGSFSQTCSATHWRMARQQRLLRCGRGRKVAVSSCPSLTLARRSSHLPWHGSSNRFSGGVCAGAAKVSV